MAANLPKTSQPRWFCGLSFTDPNDPSAVKVWRDFTAVLRGVRNVARGGAVYELGQAVAGQPQFYFRDADETLNPDNPGSPYAGNILPYRPITWCGTWPQVAGNLLNASAWRVPFDPSFEASTVGAHPSWVVPVGATTPVVGTTTPRTGSRDLSWTTLAATTIQGVAIGPVYTMPGTQYTASAYVRQTAASTQAIAVGDLALAVDMFNRATAGGWGAADVGGGWTATGGAAGDYAVTPVALSARGVASHTHTSVNVARMTTVGVNAVDCDVTAIISVPAVAVGAPIRAGVVGRWTAASDFYRASADYNTDQTVTFQIWKRVAGVETSLATATMPFTYNGGDRSGIRLRVTGTTLAASMWPVGQARPVLDTLTVTNEASITAAGQVGCWSRLQTGNTNGTTAVSYQYLNADGTVLGTTTAATGAYNRVSVTFTASDIAHTIYLRTVGTALAGTVLLDDIQLEEGAAASAFTQAGPVVYPVFNGFCERYERAWASSGFEGEALVTAVDSLGALGAISIGSEYHQAVAALNPDYYWPLDDGTVGTTFIDRSGNNRPALQQLVSKYGAGGGLASGTAMNIVGDPGGTGVHFNNLTGGATALAAGNAVQIASSAPLAFPAVIGSSWSMTVAAWVTLDTGSGGGVIVATMGPSNANFNLPRTLVTPIMLSYSAGLTCEYNADTVAGGTNRTTVSYSTFDIGTPHLVVGTITQANGGNTVLKVYYDGVLRNTTTVTTASLGGMLFTQGTYIVVGGDTDRTGAVGSPMQNGDIAHVAAWNRELSTSEISGLWTAGGLGYSGEVSGVRVARHLGAGVGSYIGPTRITHTTTPGVMSVMGPPSYQGNIKLLADTQNTVVAEGGCLWAAQDGAVVFEGRQDRWLRLAPVATFGENVAGGEIPYEPDFSLSQDPQYLYADVQISRSDGSTAVGGRTADITVAAQRFFGRPYAATVDLLYDADVQSLADWVFYTHNRPLTRAAVLTITPARAVGTDPTVAGSWAQAFSLEIGQRVRATRRAKAGNGGAGTTVTLDYFIEAVTYDDFNPDTGEFTARYLLSPIGSATGGAGVTMQPWILGDATYGILGQTTVLGW